MKKPRKLKSRTVRAAISGLARTTKRLRKQKYRIERSIQKLKERVEFYQKRCPHKTTNFDGYYHFCRDCSAAVGRNGQIIPEDSIEYPE